MSAPVLLVSLWRNDAGRALAARAAHLLAKANAYPALRWLWVVGDSDDPTEADLRALAADRPGVTVARQNTGIVGDAPDVRLRRLSATANAIWPAVGDAAYVLVHESDIVSPPDVVAQLVAHAAAGRCPIAAWPILRVDGRVLFYDTWAYRRDGRRFAASPPYHPAYTPHRPFAVDAFGTVYLFHGADAAHLHLTTGAVVELCAQLRARGRTLWVDPTLIVEQPRALWSPQIPAEV